MALTVTARPSLYDELARSPFLPSNVNLRTMQHPETIDQETIRKSQTLGQAVLAGDTTKAIVALKHGACPNTRTNPYADYMLHYAAEKGNDLLTTELIAARADIEARSYVRNGHPTPLHTACIHGKASVVLLLLRHKANVSARYGSSGKRPLELALESHPDQSPALCRALLSRGASAYKQNYLSSLVPSACKSGARENVQLLLNAKADPNEYLTSKGKLVQIDSLAKAIFFPDIMRLLLERKANVSTITQITKYFPFDQALHHAAYYGLPQSVQLLLNANADPAATNSHNQTPADVAKARFNTEWTASRKSGENPQILDQLRDTVRILETRTNPLPHAPAGPKVSPKENGAEENTADPKEKNV